MLNNVLSDLEYNTFLEYHLQYNHYPPVSTAFVPACRKAIMNVVIGNLDENVTLPNGRVITSGQIVEGLHLEVFVESFLKEQEAAQ